MYGFLKRHPYCSVSIICVVVVAGVSVGIWSASKQSNRQEALVGNEGLLFESTESYAGNLFGGDKYRFEFPFKNPTNHDVEITGTISGCRCTDVTAVPKRIPAGKSGVITGEMRLRDRQGKFTERLVVKTNTGKQYILTVQADVIGRYIVTPRKIDFSDVWWDDVLKGTVYITSQDGLDFPEPLIIAPGLHRSVNAEIKRSEKGKWCVDITVRNPDVGNYQQTVLVTTATGQSEIFIPVRAIVRGPATVNPKKLFLGTVSPGQRVQRRVAVEMRANAKTTIVKMSTSKVPTLTKQYVGDQDDTTEVDIELLFPEAEGLIEDNLVIETSSPQWTLHIPIVAFVTNGK